MRSMQRMTVLLFSMVLCIIGAPCTVVGLIGVNFSIQYKNTPAVFINSVISGVGIFLLLIVLCI